MSNIFIWVKKRLVWVFYNRGDTWQKQCNRFERGRRNRNVNLQCFHSRAAPSLKNLPTFVNPKLIKLELLLYFFSKKGHWYNIRIPKVNKVYPSCATHLRFICWCMTFKWMWSLSNKHLIARIKLRTEKTEKSNKQEKTVK